MKTFKLLFLAALFCGFALSTNAQTETRSWENYWYMAVNCDGEMDFLEGPVHGHVIDHYNPVTGDFEWYKFNVKSAEFVSTVTGEIFRLNGFTMGETEGSFPWPTGGDMFTTHWRHLKGKNGSHYKLRIVWFFDWSTNTWDLVEFEVKCK